MKGAEHVNIRDSNHMHKRLALPLTAVLVLLFVTAAGGFNAVSGMGPTWVSPSAGGNISGTVTLNVSVAGANNPHNVTFYHNQTGAGWVEMATVINSTSDQTYFNATNDTAAFLTDGPVKFNATARNKTGWDSKVITVTVDNTPPRVPTAQGSHIGSDGFGALVGDIDGYYANQSPNNDFKLNLSLDGGATDIKNVTFNMSSICTGMGSVSATLDHGNWTASCTVDRDDGYFDARIINITAFDAAGNKNVSIYRNVTLYNFSYPNFGQPGKGGIIKSLTTNLKTEENLSSVNFTMAPEFNGTGQPTIPWEGFRIGGMLNATIDFTDPTTQKDFKEGLKNMLSLQMRPENKFEVEYSQTVGGTLQNFTVRPENRIFVNTTAVGIFETTATNITLYWLPFHRFRSNWIQADNTSKAVNVFNNTISSANGQTNLTFEVSGFSGYNLTDTEDPTISLNPAMTNNTFQSSFFFNATFNGTGTNIHENRTVLNITNVTNSSSIGVNLTFDYDNLNCGNVSEVVECKTTPTLNDGVYNYTVATGDFGGSNGNNATLRHGFVTIESSGPKGTDDLNLTSNNATSVGLSPLVYGIANYVGGVGLNWSGYNASGEIIDIVNNGVNSGVDRLELMVRNRSFNTSTQSLSSWGQWVSRDGFINASDAAFNNTTVNLAEDNHQYEFDLRTVDRAGNNNSSADFVDVNITLDQTPPRLADRANGTVRVTPFQWTNRSSVKLVSKITDLAGVNATVGNWSSPNAINLTFRNATGSRKFPSVSLDGSGIVTAVTATSGTVSLQGGTWYNVSLNATDALGNRNTSVNWSFRTDFAKPQFGSTPVTTFGSQPYQSWYKDSVTAQVACSDALSGVGSVAAVNGTSGALFAGWVHELESGAGNLSLTTTGNRTYQFACRDKAGNINDSSATKDTTKLELAVDGDRPSFTDEDPDDDSNDASLSPRVKVNFSDGGSGINISNSHAYDFWFNGQNVDTDADTIWSSGGVEYAASDLSFNTNYKANVTVCDYMADDINHSAGAPHCNTFRWDFTTKENDTSTTSSTTQQQQQQQQTTGSLTITDAPSTVSLKPGEQSTFSVTVKNDGGKSRSSVDVTFDISTIQVGGISPSAVDLAVDDRMTYDITVSAPSDAAAQVYSGTATATSSEGTSTSTDVDVEVVQPEPTLLIQGVPSAVNVTAGATRYVVFDVKNNGSAAAEGGVQFRFNVQNVSASLNFANASVIDAGDTVPMNLTLQPGADLAPGVYTGDFRVEHASGNLTADLDIKVQPASDTAEQQIVDETTKLEQAVQEANASGTIGTTTASQLDKMVQDAKTAAAAGDYARAAELNERIRSLLPADARPEEGSGGGLPIIPILIFLVLLAVAGVIGYLVLAGREEEVGPYPRLGPPRTQRDYEYEEKGIVEKIRDKLAALLHHGSKQAERAQSRVRDISRRGDRESRRGGGRRGGGQAGRRGGGDRSGGGGQSGGRRYQGGNDEARVKKKKIRYDDEV